MMSVVKGSGRAYINRIIISPIIKCNDYLKDKPAPIVSLHDVGGEGENIGIVWCINTKVVQPIGMNRSFQMGY